MDFGRLYLRMNYKNEALINFQAAYYVYLSYFGKQSIPVSNAAYQIAMIMEEHLRLKEGLEYAIIAFDGYQKINGDINDYAILSLWCVITISYTLSNEKTTDYCNSLFEMMVKREQYEAEAGEENNDQTDSINSLKSELVATVIMDTTRNFSTEQKDKLKTYCELVMNEMEDYKDGEVDLDEYTHYRGIDPSKASDIKNLNLTASQRRMLNEVYEAVKESTLYSKISNNTGNLEAKRSNGGVTNIHEYYIEMVRDIGGYYQENPRYSRLDQNNEDVYKYLKTAMDPKEFIKKMIKIFENINFFSLLV